MTANPSATYRGYRRQALYVLYRVLLDADANQKIYQPENLEDLQIRTLTGTLVEAVQVKDYNAALTFSIFEPNKTKSYFYRVRDRLKHEPQASNVLVSYGDLGVELQGVLGKQPLATNPSVLKLVDYSLEAKKNVPPDVAFDALSNDDARRVLSSLKVVSVAEPDLAAALRNAIKDSIMGASPDTAMELLLWWIFQASEKSESLTRDVVLRRAHEIGSTLAAMQSYHQEWGRSIVVLDTKAVSAEERDLLKTSFEQGVQTTWRHILAEVDAPRESRMRELRNKFSQKNVVIVHGVSGQGKSTLAYRHIYDCCPDGWRFQVTAVSDRSHALNIAHALSSHAEAMGIPAQILVDVGPNDEAWPDLVTRLASNPSIKVLVVVREEDYRRAHFDPSSILPEQVDLDTLIEPEAQAIFNSLTANQPTRHFLDFKDAWSRFGGVGPLMEFTHLVTQGETLGTKLSAQIERLESEARSNHGEVSPKHLRLLTLISVASAFECRLETIAACAAVDLPPIPNPFFRFEKEYLVRHNSELGCVGGLHAVRSTFIRDHLLQVSEELWGECAVTCLSLLMPGDIEGFLLRAFSRKPEQVDKILDALPSLPGLTWEKAGGITRSLLWLGLSRYEKANRETLDALQTIASDAWMFFFDGFVGEKGDETFRSIQDVTATIPGASLLISHTKQTPKEKAFEPLKGWVRDVGAGPKAPSSRNDWSGLADVAFWLGTLGLNGRLREALETTPYDLALESLDIKELGDVVFGLSKIDSVSFGDWRTANAVALHERFLRETESLELDLSSQRMFAKFLVEFDDSEADLSELEKSNGWHEQAMRRINSMYSLFPGAEVYATQGVGFDILPFNLPHDPTHKEIPAKNLPIRKAVELNATFSGLVKLRHGRLPDWKDYLDTWLDGRRSAVEVLQKLQKGLERVLEKREAVNLWQRFVTDEEWNKASSGLTLPNLPKCAVDEWGFASDGRTNGTSAVRNEGVQHAAAMTAYRPFLKSARDFVFSLNLFFTQFKEASPLCLALRYTPGNAAQRQAIFEEHKSLPTFEDNRRRCLLNLWDGVDRLPRFQADFRELFGFRVAAQVLDQLEFSEKRTLKKLFGTCREFIVNPTRVLSGAATFAATVDRSNKQRLLETLKRELAKLAEEGITAAVLSENGTWDGERALWLTASVEDMRAMPKLSPAVTRSLSGALEICDFGEWEARPLGREWQRIIIAPQFRGRSLNKCGYGIAASTFFVLRHGSAVSPMSAVALPVAQQDWPDTLKVWTDPAATLSVDWLITTIVFAMHFERIEHLFLALENEAGSVVALEPALTKLAKTASSAINPAAQAYERLRDHLRARIQADPCCGSQCETDLARLEQWGENVFPHLASGETKIELGPTKYVEMLAKMIGAMPDTMEIMALILDHLLPKPE